MSSPLSAPERLSDRLAELLRQRIASGELAPEDRLPTEQRLADVHGVSRTVVREAVSQLKSMGLLVSRQGSGVFVAPRDRARALPFDPTVLRSIAGVLQVVEVRRGLEAEMAEQAAERITPAKAEAIAAALAALEACPPHGAEGVMADLAFHRSIARATDNPHFERLLGFLEQYQTDAMLVTRSNEALDDRFLTQVQQEHRRIAESVTRGDAAAARQAAREHMTNAALRLQQAAPSHRRALDELLARTPDSGMP